MIKFHRIHSFSNPIFRDLAVFARDGTNAAFADLFCVAGWKNNLVALQNGHPPHTVFVSPGITPAQLNAVKALSKNARPRWVGLSAKLAEKLNALKNGADLFVYYPKSALRNQSFALAGDARYVLCDHVQNPENLGAIARNAAAFGFLGLFAWGCASVFSPKTVRASAGAIFSIRLGAIDDMEAFLAAAREKGLQFIGLQNDPDAAPLAELGAAAGKILVLGNEGHGIDPLLLPNLSGSYRIPIDPRVESLNVAAASAIVFYELNRKC